MTIASTARRPNIRPVPMSDRAMLRQRLVDTIESMISVLDLLDGDSDVEDDGTGEASLGWSLTYATGSNDDREENIVEVSS